MKHIYDARIGEEDKNGKTHWKTVGKIYEKDNGKRSLMVDLGVNGKVWAQLFEPSEERKATPAPRGSLRDQLDDDIPFG